MRFGAQFWRFDWPGGTPAIPGLLAEAAGILDEAGAETLWLMDHFFQMEAQVSATDPMLEGYTTLGFLAGRTRQARLGLLVTGVMYRHPGLLAKTLTTLDVLSGGRAVLGIGAGWYEREHRGLGVPFPPPAERLERLEETIQIVRQMWSGPVGPYDGRHYTLAETLNEPRPVSPLWLLVGGSGERKTLRLVARYADACNFFLQGPDFVAAKLDALRRHCDAEGRDYDAIAKTLLYSGEPDPDRMLADLAPYAKLGIDTVYAGIGHDPVRSATRLATEVAPRLGDL